MARNYAALPHEYGREMQELSDAEFGRLCRALLDYSMSGTPIALGGNERFYAARVMAQEDRFQQSYQDTSESKRRAGRAGAEKRWKGKCTDIAESYTKISSAISANGRNGYTETNTETNTNLSGKKERKKKESFAAPAAQDFFMPDDEADAIAERLMNGSATEADFAAYRARFSRTPAKPASWEEEESERGDPSAPRVRKVGSDSGF